jgi:H+-translocating NAD(P) transhydrogenase subunit alpha
MKIAVVNETLPGEARVALVPNNVPQLIKLGAEVWVEQGAGQRAGFSDQAYLDKGAKISSSRDEVFNTEIVLQVRCLGANPEHGASDLTRMRPGQIVIGTCDPLGAPDKIQQVAETGALLFALELIPRITRAQSMDVLSSMATIAGYRAVLLAAGELPKMFPMMMTAAGTITPSRIFVIGAGVAGLQAIATAKRLGGVVSAYDVRPACREQCESVGAKFVELPLETGGSEDKGGYAKALGEEFYQRQRALMANVVKDSDVVITTALIPGKPSPLLVTADAVRSMAPGSVIIDLAAERGGNCELSKADQKIKEGGVTILGPTNLASDVPYHASQMYANNVTKFLQNLIKKGEVQVNLEDEIIRDTLTTRDGQVVQPRLRSLLGLEPLVTAVSDPFPASS